MTRVISTKLAIDGESEYRQSVANINSSLKTLKSELAKVESGFRDTANSEKALSEKAKVLNELQKKQREKIDETRAALENARKAQDQHAGSVQDYSAKIAAAEKRLKELASSTGGAAEKQEKLTAELKEYQKAQETAKAKEAAAKKGVEDWQRKLNYAERDLNVLNGKIEDNTKYLEEARASTDHNATSIDQYGKKTNQAARELKNANDTMNAMAAALAAAGITHGLREIVDTLKACMDASIEFESALAGVYKTVNGTPEQLAAISAGIKQMSTEIPATTTEIAAVAEAAGQLGIATGDVLSFSRVMLDLGESTNMSADEAATALARFANITGTSAADYERLGSVIVGLGNNFAATEAEITQMATRLASAGTLAGLTESEIMALATAMSSVGIEAEAGGTAMTQTLAAMEKAVAGGGAQLDEFARIAGMSAAGFKTAWETDAISAIQAFISGLGKLDEQGESATLVLDGMGLSGVRQSNMLKSLALASDTLTGAVGLANQAWAENTALADKANKRYETTESKLAMMNNAFANVQAAIGDALAPAMRNMAETGTQAFSWAAEFIEMNPWLVQAITGVITAVGLLTAGITALAVVHRLTAMVEGATGALSALNIVLKANPAVAVAAAIAGLAVAVGSFIASTREGSEANRELVDGLEASRKAYEETQGAIAHRKADTLATAAAIESLAEKEHKTTAEKETLLELVKQLNEEVPGLNLAYDELGGTLNMTAGELRSMVQAMAAQQEQDAAIQRMVELERERINIQNDLAAAEDAHTAAVEAANKAKQDGVYADMGSIELAAELDAAVRSTQKAYDELTEKLGENEAEASVLQENYNALTQTVQANTAAAEEAAGETAGMDEAAERLSEQIKALTEAEEEQEAATASLTAAQDMLTSALDEQTDSGTLSLDTALKLIEADYASALAIDEETGAVTLNTEEYRRLTQNKIEDQRASLETQRQSVQNALHMEDEALMSLELGKSYLSAAEARKALEGQEKSFSAQIAALDRLKSSLGSYSYNAQRAARDSASRSKKAQTQAEKDLAKFKEIKAALDHQKAMDEVDEKEYYARLAQYRDQYLTDDGNLDDYRKITEEIYKYDQKLAQAENKLWEEQTEGLISELEDRVKSIRDQQDKMAQELAGYGELFKIEDGQMALENIQAQIDALNEYESTLSQLRERGISDGLMDEVLGMDVGEATAYGQALLEKTDEAWEEYNALWEEKQRRAVEIAARFYQDQLDTLETEYNDKLGQALGELTNTAFTSGQDTAEGLINGLMDKEEALYTQARKMADEVSRILAQAHAASGEVDGSHAGGLAFVPYDGYVARLHQGERVLTAQEAKEYIARAIPRNFDLPNQKQSQPDLGSMLSQAANAMGTAAGANAGTYRVEVPLSINGKEFGRAIIDDLRSVMKSNPEVVSDR